MAEETHQQQQGQNNDTDMQTAPPPLKYMHSTTHNMAHDNNNTVVPFKHHAEPDHNIIEALACKLVFPGIQRETGQRIYGRGNGI
jgi:hypothetical protein